MGSIDSRISRDITEAFEVPGVFGSKVGSNFQLDLAAIGQSDVRESIGGIVHQLLNPTDHVDRIASDVLQRDGDLGGVGVPRAVPVSGVDNTSINHLHRSRVKPPTAVQSAVGVIEAFNEKLLRSEG